MDDHSANMPPIDFNLHQLEVFCKVVELKSFSKAGKVVYLTQPSVSEKIAALEKMVGAKLLDRLGRQVTPTAAGNLLYKHAKMLLQTKQNICLEMAAFLGVRQGEIRLGGSTIPGEYILPERIAQFAQQNPNISVNLTISNSGEVCRQVLDGALELGVVGYESKQTNLEQYQLWRDELVLAVPREHPFAEKDAVSINELVDEPFIMRETGSGTLKIMQNYFRDYSLKGLLPLRITARFGSSTAIKEGVKAGLGVSMISKRAIDTEVRAGLLKALRLREFRLYRRFHLIRDQRRMTSPLCQALLDFFLKD